MSEAPARNRLKPEPVTSYRLERLNQLSVDLFMDPSEDPEDVFARVQEHLDQAAALIQSAGAALEEPRKEVIEFETEPWEWRLERLKQASG